MSFYECRSGALCVSHRLTLAQWSFLLALCSYLPNLGCHRMAFEGTD